MNEGRQELEIYVSELERKGAAYRVAIDEMRGLFSLEETTLHSGEQSDWLINCSALSDADLRTLAFLGSKIVGPYGKAIGVPNGGLRFAKAMMEFADPQSPLTIIVDDVLTTGTSMEEMRHVHNESGGLVIFARGKCPPWVKPIFQLTLPSREGGKVYDKTEEHDMSGKMPPILFKDGRFQPSGEEQKEDETNDSRQLGTLGTVAPLPGEGGEDVTLDYREVLLARIGVICIRAMASSSGSDKRMALGDINEIAHSYYIKHRDLIAPSPQGDAGDDVCMCGVLVKDHTGYEGHTIVTEASEAIAEAERGKEGSTVSEKVSGASLSQRPSERVAPLPSTPSPTQGNEAWHKPWKAGELAVPKDPELDPEKLAKLKALYHAPTQGNAIEGLVERLRGDTQMSDRPWAVELMLEAAAALLAQQGEVKTLRNTAHVLKGGYENMLAAAQERITRLTGALEKIAANERGIDNDSIARAALAGEA